MSLIIVFLEMEVQLDVFAAFSYADSAKSDKCIGSTKALAAH